jgi:uncharacterized membrane protein YccC
MKSRLRHLAHELRAEMHWSASITGYVLRLAAVLVTTMALFRHFRYANGYWSPMTALLVVKPQWASTLSRGTARLLGTLLGAGIALALARLHPLDGLWLLGATLLMAWACFWLQGVNYAIFSAALTLYVVFSFRLGGFSQPRAADLRLINTAIGGGLALLMDFVWKRVSPSSFATPDVQSQTGFPASRKT